MSTRQSYLLQLKQFFLLFILFYFVMMNCDRMPTGPKIPDESILAVFCVLNPEQQSQTLLLQRTLTFNETLSGADPAVDVPKAQVILDGPGGPIQAVSMLTGNRPTVTQDIKHVSDFLWGSGNFNYVIQGQELLAGDQYNLSIESDEYGSIHAKTTIPGPFQVTEINIEPELPYEPYTRPITKFRVTWTKSAGAEGYLVDIVKLRYDFSEWMHTWEWANEDTTWQTREFIFPDSVDFLDFPYEEIPLRFRTIHGKYLRGFLTRELKYENPSLNMIMFSEPGPSNQDLKNMYMCRLRITIHALSKSLYDFAAFQYLHFDEGKIIGQEIILPDLSNVTDGIGVFGAATTSTAYSRINYEDPSPEGNENYIDSPWYDYLMDYIPQNLRPLNGTFLALNDSLVLSWDPVPEATSYILVVKPHYLWFYPGNYACLVAKNHLKIYQRDFPYRDCRLEWYVKAIKAEEIDSSLYRSWYHCSREVEGLFFHEDSPIFAVGPGKGPLVLYGYYFYEWFKVTRDWIHMHYRYQHSFSYSLWSETRYMDIPSGDMAGFKDSKPINVQPADGAYIAVNGRLQWQPVPGADVYLVYIYSGEQTIIAVSKETQISPPFADESEWVDGLRGADAFQSGANYTWQVCALRVKSGALGFAVDAPQNGALPGIYPRYTHPSGIMIQSQWSERKTFVVQ